MNFLLTKLPDFSNWPTAQIAIYVIAALGVVLLVYGVFLEAERRQDLVFILAAGCLFAYATYIKNHIFGIAMLGFGAASLIELIEIMLGKHHHVCYPTDMVKDPKGKFYQS